MACGCNSGCNGNFEPRRRRPIDQRTCREAIRLLKEINEAIDDFFEEEEEEEEHCGCGCNNNCGCRFNN